MNIAWAKSEEDIFTELKSREREADKKTVIFQILDYGFVPTWKKGEKGNTN